MNKAVRHWAHEDTHPSVPLERSPLAPLCSARAIEPGLPADFWHGWHLVCHNALEKDESGWDGPPPNIGWSSELSFIAHCREMNAATTSELDQRENQGGDPWIGRRLGQFKIIRQIGQGGSSRVYEVRQLGLMPRLFALKLFTDWTDPNFSRFENEARALEQLDHPGLVSVITAGKTPEGVPYLVMKLIQGQRLDEWSAAQNASPRTIVQEILKVAEAMSIVHQRNLLHRDLKPSNILMSTQGWPVVTDFGLAKHLTTGAGPCVTDSNQTMGSLGFLAPELSTRDRPAATAAVDIYGLGATLYYLLTGKTPARNTDWYECLEDLRTRDATPARRLNPAISADLNSICMRCLERDPGKRYKSMNSLAADLQRWLDHEPVEARPIGPVSRLSRWCRREPALAGLTLTVVVLLVASTTVFAMLWRRASDNYRMVIAADQLLLDELQGGLSNLQFDTRYPEENARRRLGELQRRVLQAEKLVGLRPDNLEFLRRLAERKYLLGRDPDAPQFDINSLELLQSARDIFADLSQRFPKNPQFRFDVFHCFLAMSNLPAIERSNRSWYAREAFLIIDQLAREFPDQPDFRDALANQLICLAELQDAFPHPWADLVTISWLTQALRLSETNCAQNPSQSLYRKHIVGALRQAAVHCCNRKQYELAWKLANQSLIEAQKLNCLTPEVADSFLELGLIHDDLANIAMEIRDFEECKRQFQLFQEIMVLGNDAFPDCRAFKELLAIRSQQHEQTWFRELQQGE